MPERYDRYLVLLKYVVLVAILWATYSTAELVFADYDPYRTIFSLHWLFSPDEVALSGWIVTGVVLALALLIPKFWCRFACPLGALVSLMNRVSFFSMCLECVDACPQKALVIEGPGGRPSKQEVATDAAR
ncbi:MAG: 4Fe-4S binding protein [Bacillota bacterium]|nr:4Fe-4S binding protein [Bacillota bacterium]